MARYNGRIIVGVGGKQQQADWNESDSNSPSFIKNKPNISGALTRQVVNTLPTEDIDPNCIYMIPKSDPETGDYYDEYMYISGSWEKIGSTQMAQVQSDWDETDATSPAYITNKPNNLDLVVPFTVNGSTVTTTVSTSDIMSAITAGQGVYATLDGLYLPLTVFQNTSPEKIIFSEVIDGIESIITGKEVSGVWTWELTENDLNNTTNAWYGTQAEYDMLGADALIEGKDYYIETELAKVATTGQYVDLKGSKPSAPVAYSNDFQDLSNAPTPTQSTYLGRQDLDWYGTQAEFDALEQAGQLEFYRNYYIEGEAPTNVVTGYGASYTIRKISQTDYDNLGTYDANTIYLIY